MLPDPDHYNPDPAYIRQLLDTYGISQRGFARLFRLGERTVRDWVTPNTQHPAPYWAQWALEILIATRPPE